MKQAAYGNYFKPGILLSHSHPSPPPQNEISARLEDIRQQKLIPTVKEFWTRLQKWADDGDEEFVSYASARLYHYDRTPPIAYLLRVSRVFSVSLWWLATGEGEPDATTRRGSLRSFEVRPGDEVRGKLIWRKSKEELETLQGRTRYLTFTFWASENAVRRMNPPSGVSQIVLAYARALLEQRPEDAPDPTIEAVHALLEEKFATPIALARRKKVASGAVMAAFLSTAAALYLETFTPAEKKPDGQA